MADDDEPAAERPKPPSAGGMGPDLISALPDHLLLTILLRLPTIEAIRTCLLSRRWRTLWTHLPELKFDDEDAGIRLLRFADLVDGSLHHSGSGNGNISGLEISVADESNIDAARLAAWPRVAAPRVTGRFDFFLPPRGNDERMFLELPCFPKATGIFLKMAAAELRLPRPGAGTFACLTRLDLSTLSFSCSGRRRAALGSRHCICLMLRGLSELRLQTESLMELRMVFISDLERLDVVASNLCECICPIAS